LLYNILGYREQLIKQTDQDSGTNMCRIVSAKNHTVDYTCPCCLSKNIVIQNVNALVCVYTHLIFNFDTHPLKVERMPDKESNDSSSRLLHRHFRTLTCSVSKNNPISYYHVNIEKLAEKTKGFNYASCQYEYLLVEIDQCSFLDYTYLSHVQLAIVQNTDHVFLLATYDGIAAFLFLL